MKALTYSAIALMAVLLAPAAYADTLVESYVARLSEADHFNSNGQRLTTAAAVVRQDRANVHKFGVVDPEDDIDVYFRSAARREKLAQLIAAERLPRSVSRAIVNGTPLVEVQIWRTRRGDYVLLILL
jgi:hypothetical protein